jgi:hypothetical protein
MTSIFSNEHQSKMQMRILLFGLAEMCVGFAGAILSDAASIFNLLVLFSGTAGVAALAFCLLNPACIKVYDVLGMALVLAYGTGTLNSLVTYAMDNNDLLLSSSVNEYWLSRTLGLATAAAGFLHVVGRFDSKGYVFPKIDSIELKSNRAIWFVGIIAVIAITFIATGKLGFMADLASKEGYVGVSSTTAIILDLMTPAGALALYFGRKVDERYKKVIFITVAILLLVIQFGLGRRIFVFSLLVYVMAAVLAKRPKKLFSVQNITMLLAIVMLVQAATTAFFVLRVARYSFKASHKPPSIVEMIPEAIKIYKDRDRLYIAEQIHENLSSRTFVLEYLATLTERSTEIEPTYGQNLLRAAVVATPIILYWGKYKNPLFGSEEDLLNRHFRMPVWDASNSILTASVGDFGEVGFFVMPVILCFIFSMYLRIAYTLATPTSGILVSFFICKVLLSVEEDVVAYFTSSRSVFIILAITWLVFSFKAGKSKKTYVLDNETFIKN